MNPHPEQCPACEESAVDFRGTDENPTYFLCGNGHEWPVSVVPGPETGEAPAIEVTGPEPDAACAIASDVLAILAKHDGDRGRVEVARRCTRELEEAGAEVPVHRHHPVSAHTPSHPDPYERKKGGREPLHEKRREQELAERGEGQAAGEEAPSTDA